VKTLLTVYSASGINLNYIQRALQKRFNRSEVALQAGNGRFKAAKCTVAERATGSIIYLFLLQSV
jgi:hypothetical protein